MGNHETLHGSRIPGEPSKFCSGEKDIHSELLQEAVKIEEKSRSLLVSVGLEVRLVN